MYDDGDHRMSEDSDDHGADEEATAHEFVGIINNENWGDDPNLRYRIVEWSAFVAIVVGLGCAIAAAVAGTIWVWKQIL